MVELGEGGKEMSENVSYLDLNNGYLSVYTSECINLQLRFVHFILGK